MCGSEGVQGVLTLFCGGIAQTCHDDTVVKLKEQLGIEQENGEGPKRTNLPAMNVTVDDHEWTQNLTHEVCGVIVKCGNNTRSVQTQRMMCTTQSSKSTSSLVYFLCIVNCLLWVTFLLFRRALVLIAVAIGFLVVVAILHWILLCWRSSADGEWSAS